MKTSQASRQWRAIGMAILRWAALLFFGALSLLYPVQYARISMSPQSALGVVQGKTAEEDRVEGLVDRWVLRYSFTAASGLDYQGRAAVSRSFFYSVDLGDRLDVVYAADDPGNNRLRGELDTDFVASLFLIALGAWLLAYAGVREVIRHVARRARSEPLA